MTAGSVYDQARGGMRVERSRHEYQPMPERCRCGWAVEEGSGTRSGWVQWSDHVEGAVLDALLAAPRMIDCPTCGGEGSIEADWVGVGKETCPTCERKGSVPSTDPLVILGPEQVGRLTEFEDGASPRTLGCVGMVWDRPSKSPFPDPEVSVYREGTPR